MNAELINHLDTDQRRALENIRAAAGRIWARPLHRYFTDHTVTHSERIFALLDGLTAGMMTTDKRLSPTEVFILLAAAYLHDIGMQNEKFAGGDLDQIRAHHNEQTAEMIYAVFEDPKNAFRIPLTDDPGIVEAIVLVAQGHRKVDLNSSEHEPFAHGGETLRPRLLAALLRFGDELDIDHRRVDLEQMKLMNLPLDSQLHWWKCHYVSGVSIVDEYIRVSYRFPQSRPDYQDLIVPLVETEIRAKHADLEPIFRAHAVKVALGPSQVRWMRLVKPLPPEVEALAWGEGRGEPEKGVVQATATFVSSSRPFELEMITIPAGEFLMGSDLDDELAHPDEKPQRPVDLPEFHISKYPVTNAQYAEFVKATRQRTPEHWERGKIPPGKEEHPVVCVGWDEALAFCKWLERKTGRPYRLPTEAEWEKAARGTDRHLYPWGDEQPTDRVCNFNNDIGDTTPVGLYSPQGDSPYGCADLAGNVGEWTSSLERNYPYDPTDGREDLESHDHRIARGGAFNDKQRFVRCAFRESIGPEGHYERIGFRVAMSSVSLSSQPVQDEQISTTTQSSPTTIAQSHSRITTAQATLLQDHLERGQLALFIGADLPRAVTGLPSRADLARDLARRHNLDESLSLSQVAQRVSRAGNRWEFTNFIRDALDATGKSPQPFHQRIVERVKTHQIETLVTSAYDSLLELAFQATGLGINRLVRGSDVSFVNPSRPTLIWLYGDAKQPDTLVVTEDDHYGLWHDRDREDLLDEVRTALRKNAMLFLGYNLSDPDFNLLWRELLDRAGRFALGAYAVWPGLAEREVQMWRDRGITILEDDPLGVLGGTTIQSAPSGRPEATVPAPAGVQGLAWDTEAIRQLLTAAFSDRELTALCYDHFRSVYESFGSGMGKGDKIQELLDYCTRQGQIEKLLELTQERNPTQYEAFAPRLRR